MRDKTYFTRKQSKEFSSIITINEKTEIRITSVNFDGKIIESILTNKELNEELTDFLNITFIVFVDVLSNPNKFI